MWEIGWATPSEWARNLEKYTLTHELELASV